MAAPVAVAHCPRASGCTVCIAAEARAAEPCTCRVHCVPHVQAKVYRCGNLELKIRQNGDHVDVLQGSEVLDSLECAKVVWVSMIAGSLFIHVGQTALTYHHANEATDWTAVGEEFRTLCPHLRPTGELPTQSVYQWILDGRHIEPREP